MNKEFKHTACQFALICSGIILSQSSSAATSQYYAKGTVASYPTYTPTRDGFSNYAFDLPIFDTSKGIIESAKVDWNIYPTSFVNVKNNGGSPIRIVDFDVRATGQYSTYNAQSQLVSQGPLSFNSRYAGNNNLLSTLNPGQSTELYISPLSFNNGYSLGATEVQQLSGPSASPLRVSASGSFNPGSLTTTSPVISASFKPDTFYNTPYALNASTEVGIVYTYTPFESPSSPIMPSTSTDEGFSFNTSGTVLINGQQFRGGFYDPDVAIAYTYEATSVDTIFDKVMIPNTYGNGVFDLYVWDENSQDFVDSSFDLNTRDWFDFSDNLGMSQGVSKFRIAGIEPQALIDPNNPTGFVTGLTFSGSESSFTMTPITAPIPEADNYALIALGMGLVGWLARRRG